jgi:hypothetical protein
MPTSSGSVRCVLKICFAFCPELKISRLRRGLVIARTFPAITSLSRTKKGNRQMDSLCPFLEGYRMDDEGRVSGLDGILTVAGQPRTRPSLHSGVAGNTGVPHFILFWGITPLGLGTFTNTEINIKAR